MNLDPRTPVLVGAGQFTQRPDNPADALEPVAMMREALIAAALAEYQEQRARTANLAPGEEDPRSPWQRLLDFRI